MPCAPKQCATLHREIFKELVLLGLIYKVYGYGQVKVSGGQQPLPVKLMGSEYNYRLPLGFVLFNNANVCKLHTFGEILFRYGEELECFDAVVAEIFIELPFDGAVLCFGFIRKGICKFFMTIFLR